VTARATLAPSETGTLRRRIIASAIELTARSGWPAVTMSRLADAVGVSRQTVYNEIGSKPALAEAMVLDELDRFLAVVGRAFDEHPDELIEAIRTAVRRVLEFAEDNTLLRAIVSASHGAGADLLPLLTTHAGFLLATARGMLGERLAGYRLPLPAGRLDVAVDLVVRTVLSHVMQPSDTPARTADGIAWIAGRIMYDNRP
jgi:AcrR family transcriptional regulator